MVSMASAFEAVIDEGLVVEAKKANEFPLIPGGKYPASLVKYEDRSDGEREAFDDGKANPLYGKPVVKLQVKLEGVGEKGYDALEGGIRTHFIKVCPALVTTAGKDNKTVLVGASKLAGQMGAISNTQGKPFSETLAWFESNKFMVSVGQFTPAGREPMNTTNAISALS